jgi:phosphonopyruvate decarboxylase
VVIDAESFVGAARERGFRLWTGVPCSYLTPLINTAIDSDGLDWIGAANEGDAVAIAAGAELGGRRAVACFQNSGLGNAVNPLTSLAHAFRIPLLLIPTLRGDPDGPPDEPQHRLMGGITTRLLELMEVRWEHFPHEQATIGAALERAADYMQSERRPYALVMHKGDVAERALASRPEVRPPTGRAPEPDGRGAREPSATRAEMLRAVQAAAAPADVVLATTGYTGRELCALEDRPNQLYMVGSMGCVSSLALGVATAQPARRVVALDGDGALLMRMGAMTTVGHQRPPNLVHVVLDNGVHESTGAQATVSRSLDLCAIAAGCGYERIERVHEPAELERWLGDRTPGLAFVHVPIRSGVMKGLPRPSMQPEQVAERLRAFLRGDAH